jgi:hypothetical protein
LNQLQISYMISGIIEALERYGDRVISHEHR